MDSSDTALTWFTELVLATGSVSISLCVLFAVTMLIAVIIHTIIFVILRQVVDEAGPGRAILRRVRGPTRLAAIIMAIAAILPAAEFDPSIAETMRRFLKIGMASLLGWSAVLAINAMTNWIERKHRVDVEDNLTARRVHTQIQILRRISLVVVILLTAGSILITFPAVQTYGVSLFASAGVAGIAIGFAARPILANIIAGVQIALTQPIRIDDVVIVEGEWGWVEEITATYVVIRIWDLRRLIVPLAQFIEKPFENWTRESAQIIGSVFWHVDYRMPIEAMREKLKEIVKDNTLWDGKVVNLQVVDSGPVTITVRALVTARSSPRAWDLRCEVREAMVAWLQSEHAEMLPQVRAAVGFSAPANKALQVLT